MADGQHDKFSEIFTRLERATSALEGIVERHSGSASETPAPLAPPAVATRALSDLDISTTTLDEEQQSPSVKGFNEFLELYVDPFTSLSEEIDPIVGEQAAALASAFKSQLNFIKAAAKSKKPDFSNPATASTLQPLQDAIASINKIKDDNFKSEFRTFLTAIAESAPVLSWFMVDTPVSYIPEIKDSVTFWTNKALKEFKEKQPKTAEWVKQYLSIFEGLKLHVKQYHTTGLAYNATGGDFVENLKALNSASEPKDTSVPPVAPSAAAGGAPPPPPPPPPPADLFDDVKAPKASAPTTGISAVFSELNQGENITKGLKKVDKSQMTHKNPELRASSVVRAPSTTGKKSPPVPKKPSALSRKPKPEPVVELQDNKWIVKNVEGKHDIVLDGEMTQSVFIGDSKECTIQIKGKVNAVYISGTLKCAVVVDSLVSGVDVVNSKKFGIQVVDKVPQITIDKSDEGQIYLSKSSLDTEVYTSSTTSLNINVPDESDDFKELSVPEQFKHTFVDGQITSTIVEHAG